MSDFPKNGFKTIRCDCGREFVQTPGGEISARRVVLYWECPGDGKQLTTVVEPMAEPKCIHYYEVIRDGMRCKKCGDVI